jgi:excisionase family DNA binding protein
MERLTYSIDELAETLGVSRDLINDALAMGQVKSIKVGRRRLIPASEVDALMKSAS